MILFGVVVLGDDKSDCLRYRCSNCRVLDVPTGFNLLGRVVRRIVVLN